MKHVEKAQSFLLSFSIILMIAGIYLPEHNKYYLTGLIYSIIAFVAGISVVKNIPIQNQHLLRTVVILTWTATAFSLAFAALLAFF